jgi:hypothetical protein
LQGVRVRITFRVAERKKLEDLHGEGTSFRMNG